MVCPLRRSTSDWELRRGGGRASARWLVRINARWLDWTLGDSWGCRAGQSPSDRRAGQTLLKKKCDVWNEWKFSTICLQKKVLKGKNPSFFDDLPQKCSCIVAKIRWVHKYVDLKQRKRMQFAVRSKQTTAHAVLNYSRVCEARKSLTLSSKAQSTKRPSGEAIKYSRL